MRIGQGPLTLTDRTKYAMDAEGENVCISLPLYYSLLKDKETFETHCTSEAPLPKYHQALRREISFMLASYSPNDRDFLFVNERQRIAFLAQIRRWLKSCDDLAADQRALPALPTVKQHAAAKQIARNFRSHAENELLERSLPWLKPHLSDLEARVLAETRARIPPGWSSGSTRGKAAIGNVLIELVRAC